MDELVELDIQEDLQSSPYNSPVDTDESSHSNDSYVREIHETHYSELISHTSYSPEMEPVSFFMTRPDRSDLKLDPTRPAGRPVII